MTATSRTPAAADGLRVFTEGHEAFLASRDEPATLVARRRAALAAFEAEGLPTRRLETWRYTGVSDLGRTAWRRPDPAVVATLKAEAIDRYTYLGACAARLVFVDGIHCPALSRVDDLPAGLTVRPLSRAPEAAEAALEDAHANFGKEPAPLRLLNAAWFADGAAIELAAGKTVERPVHLLFLSSGEDVVAMPRNLVRVGARGSLSVIQSHGALGEGTPALTAPVTTIVLGENARLELDRVQREGDATTHLGSVIARQARGSTLTVASIDVGARIGRVELDVHQDGDGCETSLFGLALGSGRRHLDQQVRIRHGADHGVSRQLFRSILDGRSTGVFNGAIAVPADVADNEAEQTSANLLLSADATMNTKPQLEIDAEDVRCSHGATVGAIDPEQVFYLRSRGVPAAEARSMLTAAFASDVIDAVSTVPIRARLHAFLAETMRWTRTDELAEPVPGEKESR